MCIRDRLSPIEMWIPAKFGSHRKCGELVITVQIFSCGLQHIGETNMAVVGTTSIVENPPKEYAPMEYVGINGRVGPDHLKRRMG